MGKKETGGTDSNYVLLADQLELDPDYKRDVEGLSGPSESFRCRF